MIKDIYLNGEITSYKIYSDGKIWSSITNKFLKENISSKGYYYTFLYHKNKKYRVFNHILIAQYFVNKDNPLKNIVNHKDGNKKNNHYTNLEWCTYSENLLHAYRNNLRQIKFSDETLILICEDIIKGVCHSHICEKYNISKSTLSGILNHKTRKHITDSYIFIEDNFKSSSVYSSEIKNKIYELYKNNINYKVSEIYEIVGLEKK